MSTRGSPRPPSAIGGSRPGSGARSPITTQRQRGEVSPRGATLPRGPAVMSESARRLSSPGMGMEDVTHLQEQLRQLRAEISQLQEENRNESDTVAQLRKRINILEREKLETASRYNEETTSLQGQVARLRAQLEKGEATRQNLEFELTVARKNISQEKRQAEDKEGQILRNNDDLRAQVSELSRQADDLDSALKVARIQATEQETQHRLLMEEKDKVIARCHAEQDVVTAERDKLDSMLGEQHNINSDLQDRVKELEAERSSQADTIRRQITDLDYGAEREGRAKKEIEALQQRIKQLEENIEAERAAHLESKFNSEIVQLRVRDLEGALEVEKSAHSDASMNLEMITRQLREVEAAFEEERTACNKYKEQLERSDQQYTAVQQQLSSELEEKKTALSGMSKQLGLHQTNFDELKEELARARKRQVYLEETYGGCMRELELLMDSFKPDQSAPPRRKASGKQKDKGKPTSPSVVLETLRHALISYQNRLDAAHDELDKLRKSYEKVSSENESYKDTVWSRSKALEETQATLTNTKKELSRVQNENSEHEAALASLHADMEKAMHRLDQERKKCDELNDEIQKLTKIYKNENADKIHFLHTLYQRLVTGRVVMETTDPALSRFSWPELSGMVQEQVDSLLTDLHRTRERLGHMETVVKNKDESMVHLQQNHERSMEKVAAASREREDSWAKQKSDLEQQYGSLVQELQSNNKKSQSLADQAWEQVRATGTLKEGLEAECADLRGKLSRAQSDRASLLTACALLVGALYPMYARNGALAAQRTLMEEQFNNCEAMKHQAKVLVETLSSAMGEMTGNVPTTRPWNPTLKFRVGVIAVLAANRLNSFAGQGCKLFVSHDAPDGVGRSIVCIGGLKGSSKSITGVGLGDRRHQRDSHYGSINGCSSQDSYRRNNSYRHGSGMSDGRNQRGQNGRSVQGTGGNGRSIKQAAVRWFHSPELLGVLVNSVAELQETLARTDPQSGLPSSKAIVSSARNSFAKLMNKLSPEFGALMADGNGGNYREKGALIRFLGHGLNRVLGHSSLSGKLPVMSSQQIMSSLQHHILDFTQHLHTAEVERRGLRAEVAKLHNETDLLRRHRDKVGILEDEVEHLRTENSQLVPKDRFDSVCQELSSALQREQQAQQLLNEQSSQMHQLGTRLDEGAEREKTLSEAVKDLSEAKMDMRRKEQSLRQLNKRLSQLESERRELQEGLMNAENDLRTSAKEKETLASYLKSVDIALQESKDQVVLSRTGMGVEFTLPQLMLPSEKIAADGGAIGPELIACQNVVQTFVEAQQQALSRISVLEEEITSHKSHISTLKRELSEACRREMDQDEVADRLAPETPYGTRSAPRYAPDRSYREDFAPLRGEIDNSYSILKTSPSHRRGTSMATPHISDRLRSPTRVRTPSPTRTRPLPREYSRNISGSRR
ncbi:coiled-coil domain-containing protein 171-like isoform X2 [Branchiostoma floridae x Branchiostoma japonicum]